MQLQIDTIIVISHIGTFFIIFYDKVSIIISNTNYHAEALRKLITGIDGGVNDPAANIVVTACDQSYHGPNPVVTRFGTFYSVYLIREI